MYNYQRRSKVLFKPAIIPLVEKTGIPWHVPSICIKLGREADGLDFPPYPGALGQRIFENVSKEAWQRWKLQTTMIINENRLNLVDASITQVP